LEVSKIKIKIRKFLFGIVLVISLFNILPFSLVNGFAAVEGGEGGQWEHQFYRKGNNGEFWENFQCVPSKYKECWPLWAWKVDYYPKAE